MEFYLNKLLRVDYYPKVKNETDNSKEIQKEDKDLDLISFKESIKNEVEEHIENETKNKEGFSIEEKTLELNRELESDNNIDDPENTKEDLEFVDESISLEHEENL